MDVDSLAQEIKESLENLLKLCNENPEGVVYSLQTQYWNAKFIKECLEYTEVLMATDTPPSKLESLALGYLSMCHCSRPQKK